MTRRLLLRWIAGTATGSIDRYAEAEAEAEAEDAMEKRLDKYLETVWRHGRRWVALLYARTTGKRPPPPSPPIGMSCRSPPEISKAKWFAWHGNFHPRLLKKHYVITIHPHTHTRTHTPQTHTSTNIFYVEPASRPAHCTIHPLCMLSTNPARPPTHAQMW